MLQICHIVRKQLLLPTKWLKLPIVKTAKRKSRTDYEEIFCRADVFMLKKYKSYITE